MLEKQGRASVLDKKFKELVCCRKRFGVLPRPWLGHHVRMARLLGSCCGMCLVDAEDAGARLHMDCADCFAMASVSVIERHLR